MPAFCSRDDDGFRNSHGRCYPPRLPGQTSFSEEIVRTKNCDDGFIALFQNDCDLRLAFLDVENRIRGISLGKDNLVLTVLTNAPVLANLSVRPGSS